MQQRQSADMRHEQLTAEPANYVMFHIGFGKNHEREEGSP